jgi:hypothetical protein
MSTPFRPIVVLVVVFALALTGVALATVAKPVKGAQYEGRTQREGTSVREGKTVRQKAIVLLRVAKNGKSVTVLLSTLPTDCASSGQGPIPKTTPARISSRGAFSGTISYKGLFDPEVDARAHFSGRFNGGRATGTVRAEFLKVHGCDTSTTFTAALPPKHK